MHRPQSRLIALLVALLLVVVPAMSDAQMRTGAGMKDYRSALRLNEAASPFSVALLDTGKPGSIFHPGDVPELKFQIQNRTDAPIKRTGKLELLAYGTRGIPGDIWQPEVFAIGEVGATDIEIDLAPKGYQNVTMKLALPEKFGGYMAILDLGDAGRQQVAAMVRGMKPDVPRTQFPMQALDAIDPPILERMGIRAVRHGVPFSAPNGRIDEARMQKLAREMDEFHKHGVTVVAQFGAGDHPQPLGAPRPWLDDKGVAKGRMSDHTWLPSVDPVFGEFVERIVREHGWPKGPVTGVILFNEPWEGTSISGWQADMLRYREIFVTMAEATHRANAAANTTVLVGGCDSSTNTWDKLFPDGDQMLKYLDFCSIHYQGMTAPVLYRLWNDRKVGNGRVLIWDTESWVANSDDRLAGVVASNRAAGYDRSLGVYIGNVVTIDNHGIRPRARVFEDSGEARQRTLGIQAWPPAAAMCAVQALIGDRPFREIVFNGLPWVYRFDGMNQNPDDGTIVILGDLGGVFSQPNTVLFRGVRSLAEVASPARDGSPQPFRGATISIAAAPEYAVRDFYGNPIAPVDGTFVVPLDARGFFLRADPTIAGSFEKLVAAVRNGRIEGIEAVDLQALDFVEPIAETTPLRIRMKNVLNRPLTGELHVQIGDVTATASGVSLAPHEQREIVVRVAGLKPAPDNRYRLTARYETADAGASVMSDVMRVNLIERRTIAVDGKLDDWKDARPQVIEATGRGTQSITEQAWLPYVEFQAGAEGGVASGYIAYDDTHFYFAAKVLDSTKHPGTVRFATRNDDDYFYPEVSTQKRPGGRTEEVRWPEGVRRFTYRKDPMLPSGNFPSFDNIQLAFNVIDPDRKPDTIPNLPGRMPGFVITPSTDYEYALNTVAEQCGGGFEVWRLRVPGMPPKNFYPRQPKHSLEGAVDAAKLVTRHDGATRITEVAIPWSEIPLVKARLDAGEPIKFSFKVNNDTGGPALELGAERSITRQNNLSFHVEWRESWSNEIEFAWERPAAPTAKP